MAASFPSLSFRIQVHGLNTKLQLHKGISALEDCLPHSRHDRDQHKRPSGWRDPILQQCFLEPPWVPKRIVCGWGLQAHWPDHARKSESAMITEPLILRHTNPQIQLTPCFVFLS